MPTIAPTTVPPPSVLPSGEPNPTTIVQLHTPNSKLRPKLRHSRPQTTVGSPPATASTTLHERPPPLRAFREPFPIHLPPPLWQGKHLHRRPTIPTPPFPILCSQPPLPETPSTTPRCLPRSDSPPSSPASGNSCPISPDPVTSLRSDRLHPPLRCSHPLRRHYLLTEPLYRAEPPPILCRHPKVFLCLHLCPRPSTSHPGQAHDRAPPPCCPYRAIAQASVPASFCLCRAPPSSMPCHLHCTMPQLLRAALGLLPRSLFPSTRKFCTNVKAPPWSFCTENSALP